MLIFFKHYNLERMSKSVSQLESPHFNLSVEPVFYYGLKKNRHIPSHITEKHAFSCFEYWLKKKPEDLACHLQRIQFSLSVKNQEKLFAAICDLFIILSDQGKPLRQRVLSGYKKFLTNKQHSMLSQHLTEKTLTADMHELPYHCFYKKKVIQPAQLCTRIAPAQQTNINNLNNIAITVDSYIENSQFEIALEYMEQHLEQNPDDEATTIKLIELYKALSYSEAFQNAYNKFSNHLMNAHYWDEAKQYFLNQ